MIETARTFVKEHYVMLAVVFTLGIVMGAALYAFLYYYSLEGIKERHRQDMIREKYGYEDTIQYIGSKGKDSSHPI